MAVIFIQDFRMAWQQVQKGERYVSVFEKLKDELCGLGNCMHCFWSDIGYMAGHFIQGGMHWGGHCALA